LGSGIRLALFDSDLKGTLRPARGKTMSGGLGLRLGGWARLLQNLHSTLNGIDDHFLHLQPRRADCVTGLTVRQQVTSSSGDKLGLAG
ncbi:unnamed protein product, partial [Urochloa humidicola]